MASQVEAILLSAKQYSMGIAIFLDESGDLGWSFDAPYRQGGSSRFLTIAALVVPVEKRHHPERVIRDLYTSRKWTTAKEKKWSSMSDSARDDFVSRAVKLKQNHPDISYFAMVVNKQNVQQHIRQDPNLLYNFMIKLLLVREMKKHADVLLVPDPRSIKLESGNSMHDYLQANLWFTEEVSTLLSTKPQDSKKCLNLQFADMLSGVVQAHFEDGNADHLNGLAASICLKRLYFNGGHNQ